MNIHVNIHVDVYVCVEREGMRKERTNLHSCCSRDYTLEAERESEPGVRPWDRLKANRRLVTCKQIIAKVRRGLCRREKRINSTRRSLALAPRIPIVLLPLNCACLGGVQLPGSHKESSLSVPPGLCGFLLKTNKGSDDKQVRG